MLYYSNGGPGPATKLLRVHAPADGNFYEWRCARAESRQPRSGWQPNTNAQLNIAFTGDFFMIDESQVPEVQQGMRGAEEALR